MNRKKKDMMYNEKDVLSFAGSMVYLPFMDSRLDRTVLEPSSTWMNDNIQYSTNKLGYRSDEFESNVDLLAMGCSNTVGHGLPIEHSWPEMLRSEKIKTINSIASNGDSAMGQVIKFFEYVKLFGNPKNVVAVFPAYRMEFPLEGGTWEISDKEKTYTLINDNIASIVISDQNDGHFEKYSTAPHDPNNLITKNITRYFTHTFINILESYCQVSGINFKYTLWDRDYRIFEKDDYESSLLEYIQNTKSNYFTWSYPKETVEITDYERGLSCHSEYKDHPQFYRAADFLEGKRIGHWGVHNNLHLAEEISKLLV